MVLVRFALAATAFIGMAAAVPADAAVVFSQQASGTYLGSAINRSDGQNLLEQFSLASATNVNGFDLLATTPGAAVGQSVTIKIRNSVSGAVALTNLFSFTTTISSRTGNLLHADFSSVLLGAGTYYFGMSGTNFNIGQDIFSDNTIPAKLVQLNLDNVQFTNGFVSTYNVYGDAVVAAVPEPASWAMMIVGLGAVGVAMRRRRKVSTTVRFA